MSEQITVFRPLEVIEAELDLLESDTRQKETSLLGNYIEVGRRLEEVKAQLDYGLWGDWLKKRDYSQSKANKLMRLFREYGASQQSLFGSTADSPALANLSITQALRLLALPDQEEREAFVAEHDVENMSTRELEKALKERAEALKEAEAARAEAQTAEEARAKIEADMRIVKESLNDQKENAHKYKAEANGLRLELKELKSRPVEVAVETREPTAEELKKLTAQAVEEARSADRERIAAMEKQLASADGDTAAFRVLFDAWQDNYGRMMGYLERIRGRDAEKAGKLRSAVRAAVERMV